jgi:CHAT domain-containing protein/Flp pilus assembly protein TadD
VADEERWRVSAVAFLSRAPLPILAVAGVAIGLTAFVAALQLAKWAAAPRTIDPELAELESAIARSPARPTAGRLAGRFAYRPYRPPPEFQEDDGASPELRIAAANLEMRAIARGEDLGALGVAQLMLGRLDQAIASLEEATHRRPQSAALMIDLSAAYLERGNRRGRAVDYARALAAAERALAMDERLQEAWFNISLALEGFHLGDEASRAWSRYLALDSSQWAHEARERRDARSRAQSRPPAAEILQNLRTSRVADLDAVAASRQEIREWIEEALLPRWAASSLDGDQPAASLALREAEVAAEALIAAGGDSMPLAGVAAIGRQGEPGRRMALARAHARFAQARELLADVHLAEAASAMEEAACDFRRGDSPYALWSAVYQAISDRMAGRNEAAIARLDELTRRAVPDGFTHWRGRVLWTRAVCNESVGRLDLARDEFEEAILLFEKSGETGHHSAMQAMLAEVLGDLGDYVGAWQHEERALRERNNYHGSSRSDMAYLTGAYLALSQKIPETALHFHNALVDLDLRCHDAGRLPEAYIQRANTLTRLRRWKDAEDDLRRAETAIDHLRDRGFGDRLTAEVHATRAHAYDVAPSRSIAEASAALDYFGAAGHLQRVVQLLLCRARAHERLGRADRTEKDLQAAISAFEDQRSRLRGIGDRAMSFEDGRVVFAEMIRLQKAVKHEDDLALQFAERARDWTPRMGGQGRLPLTELLDAPTRVPPDTIVLDYVSLDDRLLVWVIAKEGRRCIERPLGRQELDRRIDDFRAAIQDAAPIETLARSSAPLWTDLFPALDQALSDRTRLILLPDGPLHRLPFAALVQPSGRYLVEDHSIEIAPTLALALRSLPPGRIGSALAVGDGHVPNATVPRLPKADEEAATIASLYATARVLRGREATARQFLDLAPRFDVVHFAGHGVANADHPQYSHLLLAPDGGSGATGDLFARDLDEVSFTRTSVVVLASCATASGPTFGGEGPLNLVRPFLAGGARYVVASLWTVDDERAFSFFTRFHKELVQGIPCPRALRHAQISALRSTDADSPAWWSGFLAFGGGTPADAN